MLSRLLSVFDPYQRTLARYQKIVDQVGILESKYHSLSDAALKMSTSEFRERLKNGTSLDELLPEAYAAVREAGKRSLGMRHFDVQLIAGIAFHEGKVAEQRTGEGKTLSATLPLYLNALTGKGAHLVTVNDYLSQIGAGWMGPLYSALGMSVGVIIHDQAYLYDADFTGEKRGDERLEHFRPVTRKEAYLADITYGTNNEFGFDYLRDNMAQQGDDQVQREHHFAIVDEADSILIDEARTPLIISAPDTEPTAKYGEFAKMVTGLAAKTDYSVDEKQKTAVLTEFGVRRLERLLGISNLYEESFETIHHVEQALRALTVYHRDKDYVVRDGEVIIVDEHTGRLMVGRRYSDGLHQAIEAKEGVAVQQESRTLATISLQNYFRLYEKIAGMSGTAATEAEEFQKIYGMEVMPIPTNKSVVRHDQPDVIYKTMRAKYSALVNEIDSVHQTGRPILIGTRSIEQNQIVHELLERKKIPHQVLNAKNHEKEAFIIAQAGLPKAITVATNIAGRGVDIVLGGAKPERRDYETEKSYQTALELWQQRHDEVIASGGLHIVGTERHESRRIDNQLRGRAGRQGDPGSSRFFISLEDELMRIFGGDQIKNIMDALKIDENMPIEHPLINRAITQAQVKVEGFFFDQRKNLVNYDDVMNRQREIIYARRQRILELAEQDLENRAPELKQTLRDTFVGLFSEAVAESYEEGLEPAENTFLTTQLAKIIPFDTHSLQRISEQVQGKSAQETLTLFEKLFDDTYALRETTVGATTLREMERFVFLSSLDEAWMDHLDAMTHLRDTIWLRGAKEQALAEYKKEAFRLFESLVDRIDREALEKIFRLQIVPVEQKTPQNVVLSGPTESGVVQENVTEKKSQRRQEKKKKKIQSRTKKKKSYL